MCKINCLCKTNTDIVCFQSWIIWVSAEQGENSVLSYTLPNFFCCALYIRLLQFRIARKKICFSCFPIQKAPQRNTCAALPNVLNWCLTIIVWAMFVRCCSAAVWPPLLHWTALDFTVISVCHCILFSPPAIIQPQHNIHHLVPESD